MKEKIGVKVRSVELNVSQRCSSAMLSGTDQKEAIASGAYGVKCAIEGATGKMIGFGPSAGGGLPDRLYDGGCRSDLQPRKNRSP